MQNKGIAVKDDLMTRLNNALKQRDAAREELLLAQEELKKLKEDIESGQLQPAAVQQQQQPQQQLQQPQDTGRPAYCCMHAVYLWPGHGVDC